MISNTDNLSNLFLSSNKIPREIADSLNPKNKIHQLLILGNGFDLSCKLKSQYKDFFEYIFDENNSSDYKLNFWLCIFKELSQQEKFMNENSWTDIESQILKQLRYIEFLSDRGFLDTYYFKFEQDEMKRLISDRISLNEKFRYSEAEMISTTFKVIKNLFENDHFLVKEKDGKNIEELEKIKLSFDELIYILQTDLRELEDAFSTFLANQIYSNIPNNKMNSEKNLSKFGKEYSYFSFNLITALLLSVYKVNKSNAPLLDLIRKSSNYSEINDINTNSIVSFPISKYNQLENWILSFNYTIPLNFERLRNVHGNIIDRNIIFGIDYDKVNSFFDNEPVNFTKSFRILDSKINNSTIPLSNLDNILFYGHGLGEADYSYFQAIFDTVDLYHGKTKLIFYWNQFDDKDQYKIIIERVTKLIEKYGQTFANKDHGRNLFTKLLLENRIIFREVILENIWNRSYLD
jgi:hypothetical protein